MLGQEFKGFFDNNKVDYITLARKDLTEDLIANAISEVDATINCIAYTNVDMAELNPLDAAALNTDFPEKIAKISDHFEIPFVHISSDYVFNGNVPKHFFWDDQIGSRHNYKYSHPNNGPLKEPQNVYGKTKMLGEWHSDWSCNYLYIVRPSWLFGTSKKTFMHIPYDGEGICPTLYKETYGTPTFTEDVVSATMELLRQGAPFGEYNCANKIDKPITKFEALELIKPNGLTLKAVTPNNVIARRPFNTALKCDKLGDYYQMPTFEDAANRFIKRIS